MKKVLVLGATGSMGVHLTLELANRGYRVVAFARSQEKLNHYFKSIPSIEIYPGDASNLTDLLEAAKDIDIIYHTINIPYQDWYEKLPKLMDNIITAAKQNQCKLCYVDNIYAYGATPGYPINETQHKSPDTRKGKLRLQLEQKLQSEDINALIAHFPDFYGPYAGNTLLNVTLQPLAKGKRGIFIGNPALKREYIFLPDAAKAFVDLSLQEKSYGQNWNIVGTGVITGNEIVQIAENVLGRKCKSTTIGKKLMFFAGLFNPLLYEVREMLYLTANPVRLDGSKFEREIGALPKTPYEIGIEVTLKSFITE